MADEHELGGASGASSPTRSPARRRSASPVKGPNSASASPTRTPKHAQQRQQLLQHYSTDSEFGSNNSPPGEGDTLRARPPPILTPRRQQPRHRIATAPALPPPPEEDSPEQENLFSALRARVVSSAQQYATPSRATRPPMPRASAEFAPRSPPKSPTKSTATTPNAGSRFSFLASKMAALKDVLASPSQSAYDDDLVTMDVEEELFPFGSPGDGDAFSPAAFKNLQQTSTGLLHRYQGAYQSRSAECRRLLADKVAAEDEKSESDMRTQHLKLQLEEMSRKASETETFMRALMEELNREKKMRRQAQAALQPGLVDVQPEEVSVEYDQQTKTWRRSIEAYKTDHSSDTDSDSLAESSVFSRARSPSVSKASSTDMSSFDLAQHRPAYPDLTPPAHLIRQASTSSPGQNAFQRLLKNIAGEVDIKVVEECVKCHGQEASMAWDTANLMKDENRGLKDRVAELESALEGALDIVNGVGL